MFYNDLAAFIVANDIGTAYGTDIFGDVFPATPDSIISFFSYNGGKNQKAGDKSIMRFIQIYVRVPEKDVLEGINTIDALHKLFSNNDGVVHFTENRFFIFSVLQTAPFKLKIDSQHRVVYSFSLAIATNR